MNTTIKLLSNAYSEMITTGQNIYLKKYIKSVSCPDFWDFPFSIKEAHVSEDHNHISVIYEDVGDLNMTVEQTWVSKIEGKIQSISCIGLLGSGERRQIQFCFLK